MALHYTPSTPSISDLTLHLDLPDLPRQEDMELRDTFFPAEWHPQSGVQLTWPHARTDWAGLLPQADDCFVRIAFEVLNHGERLLVVTPEPERVRALLAEKLPARLLPDVRYAQCPTNDTWARDHAFLTLVGPDGPQLLDFQFNGWGRKFPARLDNAINAHIAASLCGTYVPHLDFVLEGGSIESDGRGTLLTTSQCLLSPQRNPALSRQEIEQRLLRFFRAKRVLWLDHGYLAGDDTDSHIDTLARFCPGDTIAYVQCTERSDEHFEALRAMEQQLQGFVTEAGTPYTLLPLPMAPPAFDPDDGHRLPATYANFLILNKAVLLPTYGEAATDDQARRQLQRAFPRHEVVPVDCRVLIRQHGSLHCSTMQFPLGVLP